MIDYGARDKLKKEFDEFFNKAFDAAYQQGVETGKAKAQRDSYKEGVADLTKAVSLILHAGEENALMTLRDLTNLFGTQDFKTIWCTHSPMEIVDATLRFTSAKKRETWKPKPGDIATFKDGEQIFVLYAHNDMGVEGLSLRSNRMVTHPAVGVTGLSHDDTLLECIQRTRERHKWDAVKELRIECD